MNAIRRDDYRLTQLALVLSLILCFGFSTHGHAENWPQFRGPHGSGISQEKGLPVAWTDADIAWKHKIIGKGHSSPVVWDDHVFITSADNEGRQQIVMNVDTAGQLRWSKSFPWETIKIHNLNSRASSTPATDGERVYVAWHSETQVAMIALDFDGNVVWSRNMAPYSSSRREIGGGTSPIVAGDLVILANYNNEQSSLIAVDGATGEERWQAARPSNRVSYSTPILIEEPGKTPMLVFTSSVDGILAVEVATGDVIWQANFLPNRAVGSPVYGLGLVFASCGGGGAGKFMAAISVDERGDIAESSAYWTRDRRLPYVPTPIVYGKELFLWGDNGVVRCIDAKTQEEHWSERVGGVYSGSPVCINGKLYGVTREGEVIVLAADKEYRLLARNQLGEPSHATPAVANGRLYFRGFEHLICLEADRE